MFSRKWFYNKAEWVLSQKEEYVIAVVAAIFLFIDIAIKSLSYTTIILIILLLLPFIMKIIKVVNLPGGMGVEFIQRLDNITKRANEIGMLKNPKKSEGISYSDIYHSNKNLALAGLRIEIEQRLMELARINNIQVRHLSDAFKKIYQNGIFSIDEFNIIADLLPLLNRAVHSVNYNEQAADWAMEIGPQLIASLDEKIEQTKSVNTK